MTHQPSFSQAEFADKKKITRREKFLARMEALIPWAKLLAVIEPRRAGDGASCRNRTDDRRFTKPLLYR